MTVSIRAARPDEAEAITALKWRSKAHWPYSESQMAAFRPAMVVRPEKLTAPDSESVVAEIGGALAGFARLELVNTDWYVDDLFVDEPFIGHGVGRALLCHLELRATTLGATCLWVVADPYAESFYQHFGFVEDGQTESEAIRGRMLPRLRLNLRSPD